MIEPTIADVPLPVDPPEPEVCDVAVPEQDDPGRRLPCEVCGAPRQGIFRFVVGERLAWASMSICLSCAMRCRPTGGSA